MTRTREQNAKDALLDNPPAATPNIYGMHVLLIGNPIDGMRVLGPFKTVEAAHEFANDHINVEWLAVALDAQDQYVSEEI